MTLNDAYHSIKARTDSRERWINPIDCYTFITHREIWEKAPKAAARKATAEGVNAISVKEADGAFYIYQITGYTPERGLFADLLDKNGRVVQTY